MFCSLSSFWVHIKRDTSRFQSLADQGETLVFISKFEAPALNPTSEVCALFLPCCWEMRQAGVHLYWDLHPSALLMELGSVF